MRGNGISSHSATNIVYTFGHGNLPIEEFINILLSFSITTLIDVRKIPYSSYMKDYDFSSLPSTLNKYSLSYIYMGDTLGSPSFDASYTYKKHCLFKQKEKDTSFTHSLKRIVSGVKKNFSIVLMCAEEKPTLCHRHLLLAKNLIKYSITTHHILHNKSTIPATKIPFEQHFMF